jgi:hypothetical protein
VPHSVFTGRPWPQPGEPLFLPADTEMAVALAEEERDTCPACGLPTAWCRQNEGGRWRFDVDESFCWATYRVASRQNTGKWRSAHEETRQATQLRVKFRPGHEPAMTAGLGIDGKEVSAGG